MRFLTTASSEFDPKGPQVFVRGGETTFGILQRELCIELQSQHTSYSEQPKPVVVSDTCRPFPLESTASVFVFFFRCQVKTRKNSHSVSSAGARGKRFESSFLKTAHCERDQLVSELDLSVLFLRGFILSYREVCWDIECITCVKKCSVPCGRSKHFCFYPRARPFRYGSDRF